MWVLIVICAILALILGWVSYKTIKVIRFGRFTALKDRAENAELYAFIIDGEIRLRELYDQVIEKPWKKSGNKRIKVPEEYMPFDEFCCRIFFNTIKF